MGNIRRRFPGRNKESIEDGPVASHPFRPGAESYRVAGSCVMSQAFTPGSVEATIVLHIDGIVVQVGLLCRYRTQVEVDVVRRTIDVELGNHLRTHGRLSPFGQHILIINHREWITSTTQDYWGSSADFPISTKLVGFRKVGRHDLVRIGIRTSQRSCRDNRAGWRQQWSDKSGFRPACNGRSRRN